MVYADNDPLVLAHARALLTSDSAVRDTLDFSQPVALILVALLHFIPDSDDPGGIIARLLGALPPAATWSPPTSPPNTTRSGSPPFEVTTGCQE